MLGHMRDLDADFLAVYGIDLEREEIGGPRFFALAHRLPAYQGVMAARVEAERSEQPQAPAGSAPVERQTASPAPAEGVKEVSLTAFRVQFPGLVSMATSG